MREALASGHTTMMSSHQVFESVVGTFVGFASITIAYPKGIHR